MGAGTTSGAQRGRTVDGARDAALREATLELLAELGYDRLTIDAVAARARAGKATIYRHWAGKPELVVDALTSSKGPIEPPDTGSLRGDLDAIARSAASMENRFDARVAMGLVTALAHDAELRRAFRERLVDPRLSRIRAALVRGVDRGEVSADRDLDLLAAVFPALLLQHLLLTGEIPEPALAERVMHDVVLPLATAPRAAPPARPAAPVATGVAESSPGPPPRS